jgi:vancomycin resistance protein YoaR
VDVRAALLCFAPRAREAWRALAERPARAAIPRLLALLVLGGIAGAALVPPAPTAAPSPALRLAGTPLELPAAPDRSAIARALSEARARTRQALARPLRVVWPGGGRELSRAALGACVDGARLKHMLREARDPRSPLRLRARGGTVDLPLPVTVDASVTWPALLALKDELDREPHPVRFDAEAHRLRPEEPGLRLDVDASLARVIQAVESGAPSVELAFVSEPPPRRAQALGDVRAEDVLGYFETRYTGGDKNRNRTFNLKLAASRIDGWVLGPGEVFDFNEVVGPRTEAAGFRPAPVIADGELADGVGGGACQIAGTLHGAALFAGMTILERHPHSRPSYYIKMGLDAAVAYGTLNLRLRNDFPFPVVLHETVEGGTVKVEILGPKRTRDVVLVRTITGVLPFDEREVLDARIPRGRRVLSQRGLPGFLVERERTIKEGGAVVGVEKSKDRYPPTTQIWRIGTGPADPKWEPKNDEHPEYVADERLEMRQGPSFGTVCRSAFDPACTTPAARPGGGFVELREAGRTGRYGWTKRFLVRAAGDGEPSG